MKRYHHNPVITRDMIPVIEPDLIDVTSVFNPGAVRFGNVIKLMLRVQNRGRETFFLMAESKNGIDFRIENRIVHWKGIDQIKEPIYHIYDPRITCIDQDYFILFAMDMACGCRLGLGVTRDFSDFGFLGIISDRDNRNGVLFPEKIKGRYLRLDRPNRVQVEDGPLTGDFICLSESNDLIRWRMISRIASGRQYYWDELIGAGPPPLKTRAGWLLIYHGIARHYQPIYQTGIMLLDLEDPGRVLARSRFNILEPRESYETIGQVPNVVFPTGLIISGRDDEGFADPESDFMLYYGAADTSICLATGKVRELMEIDQNPGIQ